MKLTIKELANELKKNFKNKKFADVNRRNGNPADGWEIVGHPGITRAIKEANLPNDNFWSGSNPTPSTQAPAEIVKKAYAIAIN